MPENQPAGFLDPRLRKPLNWPVGFKGLNYIAAYSTYMAISCCRSMPDTYICKAYDLLSKIAMQMSKLHGRLLNLQFAMIPGILCHEHKHRGQTEFPPHITTRWYLPYSWSSTSEIDVFLINLINIKSLNFYIGLVAVVSDSFDIFKAVESVWGGELKELVMERGKVGGTLVIRPDSGDPPEIVVKVKDQEIEIRELFLSQSCRLILTYFKA